MPDWFEIIEAARWLGVPPWELYERPIFWTKAAIEHKRGVKSAGIDE